MTANLFYTTLQGFMNALTKILESACFSMISTEFKWNLWY